MEVPTISDDTLQCIIYPLKGDDPAVLLTQIMSFIENMIPNHIWHRDSFQLTLSQEQGGALECTMRVGDSVDDEWLVVFLLWQVTKTFDVAASVYDADGQFLLIEAADALPSWITPDNVENRVWIYQGHLHVIPLSCSSPSNGRRPPRRPLNEPDRDYGEEGSESGPFLSTQDALKFLQDARVETRLPKQADDIIQARIAGYPQAARTQIHRTKAALPADVARALAGNPHLVQKAVECFYTRDALQLRATQKMTRFPPSSSSTVTVRMTRTAYAQLMGQRFNAPRVFRRPLEQTVDEARWWDNGVKIACGFEMLYQEAKTRKEGIHISGSGEMNSARLEALRRDSAFVKYLARLEESDYFEGEIRDSKRWKEKEGEAVKMWIAMRQADDASRPSFSQLVNEAIQSEPHKELTDEGEDPDDWLNVDPMDLDQSLKTYQQRKGDHGTSTLDGQEPVIVDQDDEDELANEQAGRLKKLAEKMEGFVEGEGALEGALFEDDLLSDEEESEVDSDEEMANKKAAMDALVAPLEPGEYGKMPVGYRHANSQATGPSAEETMEVEKDAETKIDDEIERRVRRPIFQRDKFDGVDSDDETSEEEPGGPLMEDDEDEEDRPQVVGDIEIDMEQEQEDFLRFSREALGIDDETWASIIADRTKRGVYVPPDTKTSSDTEKHKQSKDTPTGPSAARFFDEIPKIAVTSRPARSASKPMDLDRPGANPDLDSFETVMAAMEKELERLKGVSSFLDPPSKTGVSKPSVDVKGKGKAKVVPKPVPFSRPRPGPILEEVEDSDAENDMDMDEVQRTMDAELRSALKRDTEVVSSGDEDGDSDEETPMDYNLIKNFLESFKSQQGLSGPVGGLAGRLQGSDWALPRDG
ncbi:hypothetical protein M408DRAFT_128073 [Serendipita vermifera MAFF 305830]|uniref:SGT1-domain-containing protein n=1 Tax=Serendipita vermifera MAFF 305830 TaxID=933852 RepID=A0A0C2WSL6_SERVB|nr:hypothetical protein M408DRAFT_128073 [Serendipita vermifera MAFF 305830]